MARLEMPDLDKLYREAHLRNSQTTRPNSTERLTVFHGFSSFADFKRELRALLIVPIICTTEALSQTVQAIQDLLVAAVELALLDIRGFSRLADFFTHIGNAAKIIFDAAYDTLASGIALYMRMVSTVIDSFNALFENMQDDMPDDMSAYSQSPPESYTHLVSQIGVGHGQPTVPFSSSTSAFAGSPTFFTPQKPSLAQAVRELRSNTNLGLTPQQIDQMIQDMSSSNDYENDVITASAPPPYLT